MYDVIIVGAGASGMFAGITAAGNGKHVLIIEKNEIAGRKLLATGNGKCNFTNSYYDEEVFRGDSDFAFSIYNEFSYEKTIEAFEKLGVYATSKEGYYYPYSRQAKAVNDCLLHRLFRLGVEIVYSTRVNNIDKDKDTFRICCIDEKNSSKSINYLSKKVILATGGSAYKSLGGSSIGYELALSLGHSLIKPLPALVRMRVNDNIEALNGVRINARITVLGHSESGEIIFAKDSVSGIPVMQLSTYVSRYLNDNKDKDSNKDIDINNSKLMLNIDLFDGLSETELERILSKRINDISKKTFRLLIGMVNEKLATYISQRRKLADARELAYLLKNFELAVNSVGDFEEAQVTSGGVNTSELNNKTCESKKVPGLYIIGELVDVDGTCGGYNLQWAWASAFAAANDL